MQTHQPKQIRNDVDRIASRFANPMDKIREFQEQIATSGEISADYNEIKTWFEDHCQSAKRTSSNCDYELDVSRELEAEIMECLEGSHTLVAMELNSGVNRENTAERSKQR